MQDMSKISVYDSPLMHFMAIISVNAYTKTLRLSFHYTKFLAAILYINRLIMLEVAVLTLVIPDHTVIGLVLYNGNKVWSMS
jgi:hypothetical protein